MNTLRLAAPSLDSIGGVACSTNELSYLSENLSHKKHYTLMTVFQCLVCPAKACRSAGCIILLSISLSPSPSLSLSLSLSFYATQSIIVHRIDVSVNDMPSHSLNRVGQLRIWYDISLANVIARILP